jgi:RNA polymerase sigma factor (sigma-70 family)
MTAVPLTAVLRHVRRLADAPEGPGDGELLRRFTAARDEAAFAALVRRHGPLVLGVCRRLLRNRADADDAFQATFLVLVRRAATLAGGPLGPWLYSVARRTALRARADVLRRAVQTEVLDMPAPNAADSLDNRDLRRLLDEELDRLPEKYRAPLVLCYLQGFTHEQAARQLGRPAGSMSRLVGRALELLRKRLGGRGAVLPVGVVAAALPHELASGAVPASLAAATVRGALLVAAGGAATQAAALAGVVVRDLAGARVKKMTALLLALALLAGGASLAALPAAPPGPPAPPSEKSEADSRDYDLPPAGALMRFGSPSLRHGQAVSGLAFSHDGDELISCSWDGTISLWDPASGKEIRRFEGHAGRVHAVALSPDGKVIASGGTDGFYLWDAATGKRLFHEHREGNGVTAVAFSPDAKLVAYALSRPVAVGVFTGARVVEVATGKEILALDGHTALVSAVAFSPDGKSVATASADGAVVLWDVPTGKETARLTGHAGGVLAVGFAPDGMSLISGGSDGTLRLWDLATRNEAKKFVSGGDVAGVALSPDGKLVAGTTDGGLLVRVYDVRSGKEVRSFSGVGFRCVAFSPDGKALATGDGAGTVRLWEMPGGKALRPTEPHDGNVSHVALSPDGKTIAVGTVMGTVYLWDVTTGKSLYRMGTWEEGGIHRVAWSPDGKRLASNSRYGCARFWDAATGGQAVPAYAHYTGLCPPQAPRLSGLTFSPDGKFLAGIYPGAREVYVWNGENGHFVCRCSGHTSPVQGIAFGRDGRTLFSCGEDGGVRVWDAPADKQLRLIGDPSWFGKALAVSPDGRLLAVGCADNKVRLFDTEGGGLLRQLDERPNGARAVPVTNRPARSLAFSPDGRTLAWGGWQTVQLWEVATGRERLAFPAHRGEVTSVAFLPDGRRLATGSLDTTAAVWDLSACALGESAKPKPADAERLWTDLHGEDSRKSYRALWALAAAPKQALPLLRAALKPAPAPDADRLARLVKALDADDFVTREKASDELAEIGGAAEGALQRALKGASSAEVKHRLGLVLEKIRKAPALPEQAAESRALELLEHVDAPEAMALLKELAKGADGARLTEEAKAVLKRQGR